MMEIPSGPWVEGAWEKGNLPGASEMRKQAPVKGRWVLLSGKVKHVFSHFELQVIVATSNAVPPRGFSGLWVAPKHLREHALPSVMLKIARHTQVLIE